MPDNSPNVIIRLRVEGMRCHTCEEKLTAWLGDIAGVHDVYANHAESLVIVNADDDVGIDEMLRAIVHAGFIPGVPSVAEDGADSAVVDLPIEGDLE